MPSYERRTTVRAPLEDVWDFHSTVSGLEALTPDWMRLRIEFVLGPDGEPVSEPRAVVLEEGTELSLSIRPFGLGPRQYWTSIITERTRGDGIAQFRDEMVHGPFDRWVHTHTFVADGDETTVRDHVEYELPLGRFGELASPLSAAGFDAMFGYRHRSMSASVEDGTSRGPGRTASQRE